jgi:pyruvate-formate lyase-activating enzyme
MYTADALVNELKRSMSRSAFHSISLSGRDPLANLEYLQAVFERIDIALPVMLDCDGQRPKEIEALKKVLRLVQVTLDAKTLDALGDRAFESVAAAAHAGLDHALVFCADESTADAHILRLVERAHATSSTVSVVVHPGVGTPVDRDRRWTTLFERAAAIHSDIRLALRIPPPTGMR